MVLKGDDLWRGPARSYIRATPIFVEKLKSWHAPHFFFLPLIAVCHHPPKNIPATSRSPNSPTGSSSPTDSDYTSSTT